jgi:hypothetical protein
MKLDLTNQQRDKFLELIKISRQVCRQNLRAFCLPAVTQHHAGMPRRARRVLARAIAAGTWKELRSA